MPRSGNQEGSGVLGWTYKCKGWETDPNAYVYIILQRGPKQFELACKAFGFKCMPELESPRAAPL